MDYIVAVQTLGFPIAVSAYLIWQTETKSAKLAQIIENNTRVLERVNNTMAKCRR